jgi:hypothetical protein
MEHRAPVTVRPRHRRGYLAMALGAGLMVGSPLIAAAATPATRATTPSQGHAALRVTVDPHIEDAASLPGWIAERSDDTLDRIAAQAGPERWVEVWIDGETYAYRVTVTAMRGGEPVVPRAEPVVCECTSEELLVRLDAEVRRAAEELERPMPREPREPEPPPPHEPDPPPSGEGPGDEQDGLTWRGALGIGMTAVGGSGVVAGIAMIAAGDRPLLRPGAQIVASRDWRNPTGYVFLGVGAGVLAGGIVLWVLDARPPREPEAQARTARRPARRLTWAAAPWLTGRGELGLGVVGRFESRRW